MNKTTFFSLGAALLLALPASGSGVNWASPFGENAMFDSHGNLLDSSFVFELGTFATGFTPNALNWDQWSANWKLLDRADDATGGWVSVDIGLGSYFTEGFNFLANGTVDGLTGSATFLAGEQAYIWVRSGTEWALVTDAVPSIPADPEKIWQLPNPADSIATPLSWDLSTATAVLGTVNNGPIRLQTSVIPEPSTSLLVLMLGCLLQFTRHKRRLARS